MSAPGPIGSGSPGTFSQALRHPFPFSSPFDVHLGPSDMRVAPSDLHVLPQTMPDRDRSMNNMSPLHEVFVLVRNLPLSITQESLRLILLFSSEVLGIELLPREFGFEDGFRCALVRFRSLGGAQEARQKLHGRYDIYQEAELLLNILPDTTLPTFFDSINGAAAAAAQPTRPNRSIARQMYNSDFSSSPDEPLPQFPQHPGFFSELPMPETSTHYQNLFSPQSPIGNHLTAQGTNESSKALISGVLGDDDETSDLLKDPVAYAENNVGATSRRRATAPQVPIGQMAMAMSNLTLNSGMAPGSSSLPPYVSPMSPGNAGSSSHGYSTPGQHQTPHPHRLPHQHRVPNQHQMSGQQLHSLQHQIHAQHHVPGQQQGASYRMPAANPADQNPPCNTLYVGNLPMDTSEEELKAMFSKQRGYKRLCFRTKQNGPMCFVEFEDVSFATKALKELYGHPLHNSVRGGIRLSFSKNPLGVRSGQQTSSQPAQGSLSAMNAMGNGMMNGFTSASGPPPGLTVPPGLGAGRPTFNSNGVGMNGGMNGNGNVRQVTFPLYTSNSNPPSAPSTLSVSSALPALSASPASPALPIRSALPVPSAPLERNDFGIKSSMWEF